MEKVNLPLLYQNKQQVLNKINHFFLTNRIGYLKVPTGWGKTLLSKYLIKQYYQDNKIVLFICSQNNQLLTQTAYNENNLLFPDSDILSSDYHKNTAKIIKEKLESQCNGYIIFASLQSILSKKNQDLRQLLASKVDLVIVDEIHNFIDNNGNKFIQEINLKAKIFGMTATPFQGMVGKTKLVTDIDRSIKEIHNESLLSCINNGILAKLKYSIIYSNQNIMSLFDFSKGLEELTKHELLLDCSTKEKVDEVIKRSILARKIYNGINPLSKTLIFCSPSKNIIDKQEKKVTSFHAKLTAMIFNNETSFSLTPFKNYDMSGRFKNTVYLSSDLPSKEKESMLIAFRKPFTPPYVLCTIGMLIEGFDFPELENLILLRPTLSMRLFEQQIGRILRLSLFKGKTCGNVFEITDNIDSLYSTYKSQVFNERSNEQIQMLCPKVRLEKLLYYDDGYQQEPIISNNVNIIEVEYLNNGQVSYIQTNNQRLKHLNKLISILSKVSGGSFIKEKNLLLSIASRVRIHNFSDIKYVLQTIDRIKKISVSNACKEGKPQLFYSLEQMLKLNLLSALEKIPFTENIKSLVLKSINCSDKSKSISEYKIECIEKGSGLKIHLLRTYTYQGNLIETVQNWLRFIP